MIYNNIEFHNTAALEADGLRHGLSIMRFPRRVRLALERGKQMALKSAMSEMRFVTNSNVIRVTLSAAECDGELLVYKGDFFHSIHELKAGVIREIQLAETEAMSILDSKALGNRRFSPNVWRLIFGSYTAVFYQLDTFGATVSPPDATQTPSLRWAAYGSSITQGYSAISIHNCYVYQTARRLNADVLNLGLSGACYCEKEMVHYISEQVNWDLLTIELGINILKSFTPIQCQRRIGYLIDTVVKASNSRPVAVISPFTNLYRSFSGKSHYAEREEYFCEILRKIVEDYNMPNLCFIDGRDILQNLEGLTTDMVHPSDIGHIDMGINLAEKLTIFLNNNQKACPPMKLASTPIYETAMTI